MAEDPHDMEISPTCEPIRTVPGQALFVDTVQRPAGADEFPAFVHFHPQAELVWFRSVRGQVRIEGSSHPISDRQAVFLPSMLVHAFHTGQERRDWVLLQFEPHLLEALFQRSAAAPLLGPLLLQPDPARAARIDFLCDWLAGIADRPDQATEAQRILELLLLLIAGAARTEITPLPTVIPAPDHLQSLLASIHADPRNAPQLAEAARIATMTPATFSRRFKSRIGMSYAAYVQTHRLNVAAGMLLAKGAHISQVAYAVGFASAAHFSTAFASRFGLSPRDYRLRAHKAPPTLQESKSV